MNKKNIQKLALWSSVPLLAIITAGLFFMIQPRASAANPESVDQTCQTDADCTVKDVGNCCGYYPACVNQAAKTDPEAVRKKCEQDGMASICGFEDISSCSCVEHRCVSAGGSSGAKSAQ
jgi:hypothetical protein